MNARYIIRRSPAGEVSVSYHDGVKEHRVKHLVHHSPTGLEYGYGGSGPADLARSIMGHHLGRSDPQPATYQDFKFKFIATLDRTFDHHEITVADIMSWHGERFRREVLGES